MKTVKQEGKTIPKQRPAMTPEADENQMVAYAVALAEKQLREGTASSAVICHYLKLGASTAKLEKEKLEKENELLVAKVEALQSSKRVEELYTEAIKAMQVYSGRCNDSDDEDVF